MSQKNTLFNYFGRGQTPKSSPKQDTVSSPKSSVKLPSATTPTTSNSTEKRGASGTKPQKRDILRDSPKTKDVKCDYKVCDIVWAKLESYPWWPSLVCNDPDSKRCVQGSKVHVQFFDNPPTRSWVTKKLVETYKGSSDKPAPTTQIEEWKTACGEADNALKISHKERESLLVNFKEECKDKDEDKENDDEDLSLNGTDGTPETKRRRVFQLDSEDSEDEFKPNKEDMDEESSDDNASGDENLSDQEESDVDDPQSSPESKKRKRASNDTPKGKPAKKAAMQLSAFSSPKTPTSKIAGKASLPVFSPKTANASGDPSSENNSTWTHLTLDFLKPENIRDIKKNRPDSENYNPRTLFVPEDFIKKLTPGMRQWWELKSTHYDCVLFFKVGKFYELYHMDAVVGCNECNLTYMKGEFAHSGFPEKAYGRFSSTLIDKGYKVARVEQTETPEMVAERCKTLSRQTKYDKVVKREICAITSLGTQVYSIQDGEPIDNGKSNYLLAICEESSDNSSVYGVCFVDTSIGTFYLGEFTDDRHSSRLLTLLAHRPPVHVLSERNRISQRTRQLLHGPLAAVAKETLASESEFWSASKTLSELAAGQYFVDENGVHVWPEGLKPFISADDPLGLSPSEDCKLAVRALGALTWYLRECLLDQQLLTMRQFQRYSAVDERNFPKSELEDHSENILGRHMILDDVSLRNLEVCQNKAGGREGTLLNTLDHCCTPFGKRLLYQWICAPLLNVDSISARQEAISELLNIPDIFEEARGLLSQLPDLERFLSKIHSQGSSLKSKNHPDGRAIFYEDTLYSKKKITGFISTLEGFKKAMKIGQLFQDEIGRINSKVLRQCIFLASQTPEGTFPELQEPLVFFDNAFDHEEAEKAGSIIPTAGVDKEFDAAVKDYEQVKQELNDYLVIQRKHFGCKVVYVGTAKNRFQIEVPDHACKKATEEYEYQSQRKGFKRFWTSKTKELLNRMIDAEERKATLMKDLSRRIYAQFSNRFDVWNKAVQNLAVLDVLLSLTEYIRKEEGDTCIPSVVKPSKCSKPFVRIVGGRHPCMDPGKYIPNDTTIGTNDTASVVLVTGPNMGGKSTLMRQAGILLIMAHMGCHIPAREFEFSPVDRIFTRLGANDDIMAGESTFFVELSETSAILKHATKHSLILVDELGRGTSTYDGTAIAWAVVNQLIALNARTLFSTHYHTLVEQFKNCSSVTLGHMACQVENDGDEGGEETVTFLYKFVDGACPKSYGFNAARLAGIPAHITRIGRTKAAELEKEAEKRRVFRSLCGRDSNSLSVSQLQTLLGRLLC